MRICSKVCIPTGYLFTNSAIISLVFTFHAAKLQIIFRIVKFFSEIFCLNTKTVDKSLRLPTDCFIYSEVREVYSYLIASIGSSLAAFFAGYHPKNTPVKVHTAKLMMMLQGSI